MPTLSPPLNTVNSPQTVSQQALSAAWAALNKVSDKESVRDDLRPGSKQQFALNVTGHVDGTPVSQSVSGVLSVGCDVKKASSRNPAPAHVLAVVVEKLNEATRKKVLAELPTAFARFASTGSNSDLPEVDELIVHQADQVLAALRSTKRTTAKGAVRCSFVVAQPVDAQPPLSIVG